MEGNIILYLDNATSYNPTQEREGAWDIIRNGKYTRACQEIHEAANTNWEQIPCI